MSRSPVLAAGIVTCFAHGSPLSSPGDSPWRMPSGSHSEVGVHCGPFLDGLWRWGVKLESSWAGLAPWNRRSQLIGYATGQKGSGQSWRREGDIETQGQPGHAWEPREV